MYCEHCGTQIPEGSIFCVACGKKQSGGVVTEEPRQDVIPPQEPEPVVTQEPEPAAPQPEQESAPANDEFDWSTFNPVPEEPEEPVKAQSEPVQQEPVSPWQASAPQQETQSPWQASAPQQGAQNPWQSSQQSAPGWQQQNGWQNDTQQAAPGWQQQSGWQNSQQGAPGWQQQKGWQQSPPGWQNNQQQGWQSGPQQGYQGNWQSQPQQSAYSSPYEERKQPTYRNGRIDYGCPMNWYKFQVYFCMIPNAFYYLILGVLLVILGAGMAGYSAYASSMDFYQSFIYALRQPQGALLLYLPSFIPNPLVIGLICVAYGILMFVAWVKMIRLQQGGWSLFLVLSALPTVFVAINMLMAFVQVGQYIPSGYMAEIMTIPLVALVISVLILILQIIYFKKRSYLFVNH